MRVLPWLERLGRATVGFVAEVGYQAALAGEAVYWVVLGPARGQPVRLRAVVRLMRQVGVDALPIVLAMSFAVGVILALQGIHSLRPFGAEEEVVLAIMLAVSREFGPLVTAILVAGRSGSSLAAWIGTMKVSQEIDALRVMSINPVRYLVSPVLVAMLIVVPSLAMLADLAALAGGAVYCAVGLDLPVAAFFQRGFEVVTVGDFLHGLTKAWIYGLLIAVVAVSNGFSAAGGAEGVGRVATRSVVMSLSYIFLTDMVFTYLTSRSPA